MDTEIEFRHSIYEPFDTHMSGHKLPEIEVSKITKPAASALNRESGYFFETQNNLLIFGFLTKWSQKEGASRMGEFFFNVFTMSVEDALDVDLHALKQRLEEIAVDSPESLSSNTTVIRVNKSDQPNDKNIIKIINQWREYGRAQAKLSEISSLIAAVPDLMESIRFVSECNREVDHYNICEIGEINKMRNEQSINNTESLYSYMEQQLEIANHNQKMINYIMYGVLLELLILTMLLMVILYTHIL